MSSVRERYGEAFWRAHHEAWQQSELKQREYCEAQGIPLKAFGNWRARFKAEPQPPSPKLLYRRHGLSHTLSHSVSHRLSHMTNGSPMSGPIVPPAREGQSQPRQDRLLGWYRPLPVHQTARARRVYVAVERRTWRHATFHRVGRDVRCSPKPDIAQ
jgi:hypothetical protein